MASQHFNKLRLVLVLVLSLILSACGDGAALSGAAGGNSSSPQAAISALTQADAEVLAQTAAAAQGYTDAAATAYTTGYLAAYSHAAGNPQTFAQLKTDADIDAAALEAAASSGLAADELSAYQQGYATLLAYAINGGVPTIPIANASSAQKIEGEYIIQFTDDAPEGVMRALIDDAGKNGGEVHHIYEEVLNGFAATLPEAAVKGLQHNPHILSIEVNQTVQLEGEAVLPILSPNLVNQTNPPSWGLARISTRQLDLTSPFIYPTTAGRGVHVYVMDTGIQATHTDFGSRVGSGTNSVVNGGSPADDNGHGTHVAGTIGSATYGVAKAVTLHSVKVLNAAGAGTIEDVIEGLQWIAQNHPLTRSTLGVVNISLNSPKSQAVNDAVNALVDKGLVVITVAGNNNGADACTRSPAGAAKVLTVGATDKTDTRASFSNIGPCVKMFAPGTDITSLWMGANGATKTMSGTSMAAPHVAGVAALYISSKSYTTPQAVYDDLLLAATRNVVKNPGTGSANRLVFSQLIPAP